MKSVSVVIPVYNNWAGCHQLLLDLYSKCSLIEEVILVDDASTEKGVRDGIAWWKSTKMLPIELITMKENVGFSRASNAGLRSAVEDVVCLVSTDVRVQGDVIELLQKLNPSEFIGGRLLDFDTGWNTFNEKIFPYLEGWFVAAHQKAWSHVEYLDERYSPYDMEDIDLSTTAVNLDYTLKVIPDGYLSHIGAQSASYGDERSTITNRNKILFEEKWLKVKV